MEVQTGCRLVENKEGGVLPLLADEVRQLYTLVFTSREGGRALTQLDVSQADIGERFQSFDNLLRQRFVLVVVAVEELDGLGNRHIQNVVDVLTFISHIQDVLFEAMSVTGFAFQHKVGHELHLDVDDAGSLTHLATASVGIEREILWREVHLLGQRLLGKQLADAVVSFHIGCRIRACTLADWVLVYHLHVRDVLPVAFQSDVFARQLSHFVEVSLQGRVEDALHKRRLTAAAHACYYC